MITLIGFEGYACPFDELSAGSELVEVDCADTASVQAASASAANSRMDVMAGSMGFLLLC